MKCLKNDRLVTDIVNIDKSVSMLYLCMSNGYVKKWQNDGFFYEKKIIPILFIGLYNIEP